MVRKIEIKRQQLTSLKQKLLSNNQTTESELNNLCQLQKELTYLEQQQNQIIETKILQETYINMTELRQILIINDFYKNSKSVSMISN